MTKYGPKSDRPPLPHTHEILAYGRDHRLAVGLSQAHIADIIGSRQSHISGIESGKQIDFWFSTARRYWRAIGLRVSLVFWRGQRIGRVFEVGARPTVSEPGLAIGAAPMPDVQGGAQLLLVSEWARRRFNYTQIIRPAVMAGPDGLDQVPSVMLQLCHGRTVQQDHPSEVLAHAGWVAPA